jgi:hypothetical protein
MIQGKKNLELVEQSIMVLHNQKKKTNLRKNQKLVLQYLHLLQLLQLL